MARHHLTPRFVFCHFMLGLLVLLLPATAHGQADLARSLQVEAERQRGVDDRVTRLADELRTMMDDLQANRLAHQGGHSEMEQVVAILDRLDQQHVPSAAAAIDEARRQPQTLRPNLALADTEIATIIQLLDEIRALNRLDYDQLVALLRLVVEQQKQAELLTTEWGQQLFLDREAATQRTPEVSSAQRDVARQYAEFLRQLDALQADPAELEPAQVQALGVAKAILQQGQPGDKLAGAADDMDRDRAVPAVKQQKEALVILQEALDALELDNLIQQLQQLQAAKQQVEQIKQEQQELQEKTEQAKPEEARELQAQQLELQRQLEQVQLPQPQAEQPVQQAVEQMQQAQQQLAQQQPQQATPPQQEAVEHLEQALKQIDQQMAQIEQTLTAETPIAQELRQLQQQQQQLQQQTQMLPQVQQLAQPQQQLAQQVEQMAKQKPEVQELQQTAQLMKQAAEQLEKEQAPEAQQKQQEAMEQLAQAVQKVQQAAPPPPAAAQQPQPPQPPMLADEIGLQQAQNDAPAGELRRSDADWQSLQDRDRGPLNQDYAQDLPAEYRQLLEDYYEALSR